MTVTNQEKVILKEICKKIEIKYKCDKKHKLKPVVDPYERHTANCSTCRKQVPIEESIMHCKKCQYDLCLRCKHKEN
jgi:hypothetical protein